MANLISDTAQQRPHPGDSQIVELLGRNRLIAELMRDGLEVAVPIRDRGIDLIVYADRDLSEYVARPIQMKAAWTEAFAVDRKYDRFPGLLLAYVRHVGDAERARTFALPYVRRGRQDSGAVGLGSDTLVGTRWICDEPAELSAYRVVAPVPDGAGHFPSPCDKSLICRTVMSSQHWQPRERLK